MLCTQKSRQRPTVERRLAFGSTFYLLRALPVRLGISIAILSIAREWERKLKHTF